MTQSMTATPQESYEIERGSALLSRFSETVLTEAIHALQKSGTIIKIDSRASRRLPGRNYMFSDKLVLFICFIIREFYIISLIHFHSTGST